MAEMYSQMRRDEFHRFMDLPLEIRDLIYGFALCKGTVIVPNSGSVAGALQRVKHCRDNDGDYYWRYEGLEQELLEMENGSLASKSLGLVQGVSRAVHDEATRIFFGRNEFIFPAGRFHRPAYCNLLDTIDRSSEADFYRDLESRTNNAPLLRNVSYTFDMRDHPCDDYANLYRSPATKEHVDGRTHSPLPPGELLQALHDQKTFDLEVDWAERIDCIKRMTLDRLVLAFEECYCAIGCCRKVEWVLDRLFYEGPPPGTADTEDNAYSSINWYSRPPPSIVAMGFVNRNEELMAIEKLRRLQCPEIRPSTTFARAQDELANGTGPGVHLSQRPLLD